ncbi:MAG: pilus assembly protein TadG-related protein [Oscillochloridaceae bacterium umkhey_bin13]
MHKRIRQRRQQGQSLPIVVLMLGTLFMIIGLGIDGGLLYAQRRLMQNTADAACLAAATRLAMGETNLQAEAAARQVVQNNLGATPGTGANAPGTLNYAAIADLYTPVTGSGPSLSRGIVLNGPEIRVALESSAFTYFLRVLGQEEYTVAARARCDATAGGGGSPFAVARWRAYRASNGNELGGLSTDLSITNQNLSNGNPPFFVRDVLGRYSATNPDPSRITQWPGWGSPDYPGSPNATPPTGLFSQALTPATPQNPGFEVAIAGSDATANQGSNAFAGQVLLDWRNITLGGEFYGGLNPGTNPNTYKDIVTRNIVEGYNGPWIPPGTQLGFTNGVSAGQVEQPFQLRNPTLPFTMPVLVYNGTVYESVNLQLLQASAQPQTKPAAFSGASAVGQPAFPANCLLGPAQGSYMYDIVGGQPLSTTETLNLTPINHTVTLRPYMGNNINNSPAVQSGARIRSFASVTGTSWNDLQVQIQTTLGGSSWLDVNNQGVAPPFPAVGQSGININNTLARPFNLRVQQSRVGTCTILGNPFLVPPTEDQTFILPVKPVQGPAAIYLEAEDTNTGLRRGRYVLIRTGGTDANNFYAYFPNTLDYEPIDRPSTGTNTVNVPFDVETTNGNSLPFAQLNFSNYTWFENGNQIGAPADIGVTVVQGQANRPNLRITVGPNAPINRDFHVRVQVNRQSGTAPPQWLWYYVRVRLPVSNSNNVSQYVYTLGYANFRVTRTTANNIYGVAVSGLLKPGDVIVGMQPRLLPWED